MSKNIVIQKSGTPVQLTGATKLSIPTIDGINSIWVPEDDRKRVDIDISENGTYIASDSGAYAFKNVNVNVKLQMPCDGTTSGGTSYTIYRGDNDRPYIKIIVAV